MEKKFNDLPEEFLYKSTNYLEGNRKSLAEFKLNNMNKSADIDKYKEGIKLLKENGIVTMASFIIGFPGETYETVKDTINFIEETQPDFYRAQLWYCEPITPIWNKKDKYGIKGA